MERINTIRAEIKREGEETKKILRAIPMDRMDWKPHEKSMSLGALAVHIAQLCGTTGATLDNEDYLDLAESPAPDVSTVEDIVNLAEEGIGYSLAALNKAKPEDFEKSWELRYDGTILMQMSKGDYIRKMGLNHIWHHRGQLSVYLRLLDVPVPGLYGPSADER